MTDQQINVIVESINTILEQAKFNILALEELCDKDYLHGRETYPITSLVYSAFNVQLQNIPGLWIQKVMYGRKKLYLPELFNNEVYIEVFRDTAKPCSTEEVKMKYDLMRDRFRLLIFSVDTKIYRLKKLQLLSFDGFDQKGNVQISKRETIYEA